MSAWSDWRITMISAINPRACSLTRLGAAAAALLGCVLALAAPAHAEFGVSAFSADVHQPASFDPASPPTLTPVTQAGAHADMTTAMTFNTIPGSNGPTPAEPIRSVEVDLPMGFYGNPNTITKCSPAKLVEEPVNGPCPVEAQAGVVWLQAGWDASNPGSWVRVPVYNLEPRPGETAALGFAFFVPINMRISVRTDGDNGLRVTMKNLSEGATIYGVRMTLWGVPADPIHDTDRMDPATHTFGIASTAQRKPFLTLPTTCSGTNPVGLEIQSWSDAGSWVSASDDLGQMTGCDNLSFDPSISVTPDTTDATTPTGYTVGIDVPQDDDPDGLSTPTLHKIDFQMPDGVALSASAAWGLTGCGDADAKLGSTDDVSCPETSKLGTVTIDTPLLADQLTGDIYLRSPQPGHQFRLLLTARGPGFVLKIPGEATPDQTTGRISAVFDDTPQLPFSSMQLKFRGGDRAPLANPETCGTKTSEAALTPSSGTAVTRSSSFTIANCTGAFSPTFDAGTLNPLAATFSGFTTTIRRPDGQDDIRSFSLTMPSGLLGMIKSVPLCADADAAAGTCGAGSQIGTTTVESGSGPHPFALGGKVYIAGPYKGAPFSLSVVVPALAGPFDLGTVVVRAPIAVDRTDAQLTVSAELPTILQGVPLRLQTISITIDRPEFMFNGTNCTATTVGAAIQGAGGSVATVTRPYQPTGCSNLGFAPLLTLAMGGRGETGKGGHPELKAHLRTRLGDANLRKVTLALPDSIAVDLKRLNGVCTTEQDAAGNCPESSLVGSASADSVLHQPLSGPVHLVEGVTKDPKTGKEIKGLPGLSVTLQGEGVTILLHASTAIDTRTEQMVETFDNVPDVPISSFDLTMNGGDKGILTVTKGDLCRSNQIAEEQLDGQNGKRVHLLMFTRATGCVLSIVSRTVTAKGLRLKLGGLGAGKLTVSGAGIAKATRTIKAATAATVGAKLTATGKQMLAQGRAFKVTVSFDSEGSARPVTRTVTVRPKR